MSGFNFDEKKRDSLEIVVSDSGESTKVTFKGAITESAVIHPIKLADKKSLYLDFDGISYINSAGVRRWILWMWNIEKECPILRIIIERCPTIMSKQIVSIMRFVPKLTQVRSFYIPYFCETCQTGSLKLFESKPLLGLDEVKFNEAISIGNCKKCSNPLLVDTSVDDLNKLINDYKTE